MGIRAAVAARLGSDANGAGFLNPLLRRQIKTVQPSLTFNPIEFDGIKTRVVEALPNTEELDGVPTPQPVEDDVVGSFTILESGNVGEADVVLVPLFKDRDGGTLYVDGGFLGFVHVLR